MYWNSEFAVLQSQPESTQVPTCANKTLEIYKHVCCMCIYNMHVLPICYVYIYIYIYIYMGHGQYLVYSSKSSFLKSVLSFFRFWYISKCYRFLKSVLSFSKPQLNFQKIETARILLSINLNFGCSSYMYTYYQQSYCVYAWLRFLTRCKPNKPEFKYVILICHPDPKFVIMTLDIDVSRGWPLWPMTCLLDVVLWPGL